MSSELRIENAKQTDYDAVVALLRRTDLPPDEIELHMENFLIIRHPEEDIGSDILIGSVGLEIYEDSALLRSLSVDPDFQGSGLGSRLVDRIIEVAKTKGFKRLFLLTDTAEDFFKKRGFTVVTRDRVPDDMKQSIEFTTLCTSSPSMMREI
ncbi:MAG: arsenic resistance N-acetyltransferase ArsN2 [Candidatus Thorarchaeota archaeon]|jgi:amino-acid N-acetyltransferase